MWSSPTEGARFWLNASGFSHQGFAGAWEIGVDPVTRTHMESFNNEGFARVSAPQYYQQWLLHLWVKPLAKDAQTLARS